MFASRQASFEAMVRAYAADLYRFAYWLCRDRGTAEDLVQETFRRAWQHWPTLRAERAARAWLLTTLRREHARLYERRRLDTVEAGEQELAQLMRDDTVGAIEMRDALGRLPVSYREPLLLQVLFGFSAAEIAGMLSLSEAAVTTRLSRARLALRRLLDPVLPESWTKAVS